MTATVHKLKSAERLGDCRLEGGTVATHEPGQSTLARPLRVSVNYRSGHAVVAPTFVCRTHKAPVARGHRTYLEVSK